MIEEKCHQGPCSSILSKNSLLSETSRIDLGDGCMSRIPVQQSATLILSMANGTLSKLQNACSAGHRFSVLRQSLAEGGLDVRHIDEGKLRIARTPQWRDGYTVTR